MFIEHLLCQRRDNLSQRISMYKGPEYKCKKESPCGYNSERREESPEVNLEM
jgi:hypothetical protein